MKILFFLLQMVLVMPCIAYAGVGSDMEEVFNSFGGGANNTEGGAYQTQRGGYYTGGSFYGRVPTRQYQFMNFQPPQLNAGCGGIDMFAGAFSFVNSKQLVEAGRQIMGNAIGYSFNLALQTFVPQVYNTMQKLNDIAREMNNFNIGSCETAAQLLGGVWPKSDAASRQLCQSMGTSNGKFGDYARARQECGAGGKREETNSNKTDKFKDQLGDEFNIAWEAVKKHGLFATDKSLAELFMSISGTIVAKKGSGNIQIIPYASLVNNEELFEMLMYGEVKTKGSAEIYECGSQEKCLDITKAKIVIDKTKALVPKIEDMLRNMADKMRNHSGDLTNEEKALIELTQIPILKIIAVQNAFMIGNSVINVNEFADSIAYDFLLGYMEKMLDFVSIHLAQLEKVQINGDIIKEFKSDIVVARKLIMAKRMSAYQGMHTVMSVIQKSNLVEAKLNQMFSSYNEMNG